MHFATPLNKEMAGFGRTVAPRRAYFLGTVRFGSRAHLNCERSAVLLKGERTMTVHALRSVDNALTERLLLSDHCHIQAAATALAEGAIVAQAFANFYVITTKADAEVVRSVNVMKGRPPLQVGSITTTPLRIPFVFDWAQLPSGVSAHQVLELMDHLFALGPFGFRGPAAPHLPAHLTQLDGGINTAQVIAPGYACPSNEFLASALHAAAADILYITSANRSRHLSGLDDEPAHWQAEGLRSEFAGEARFVVLEHDDEQGARAAYPRYAPMSTTILAFHKTGPPDPHDGRLRLVVERHGSLGLDDLTEVVAGLGFGLTLGANAHRRLSQRQYISSGTGPVTR
jgi:tRNA A37 threonylcarbamoyladenosine synthetase subunit TsaC/SUA5/YrdC